MDREMVRNLVMNKEMVHKLVMDMDEETELAFLEELLKKRVARIVSTKESVGM